MHLPRRSKQCRQRKDRKAQRASERSRAHDRLCEEVKHVSAMRQKKRVGVKHVSAAHQRNCVGHSCSYCGGMLSFAHYGHNRIGETRRRLAQTERDADVAFSAQEL